LAGIKSLNFDLMYGLPNQTIGDLAETLSTVTRLAPDRIAFFGYAHVPDLIPRQRRISSDDLPTAEGRFSQAAFGRGFLISAGWEAVGFDHFALPDDELAAAARAGELRRNFQGFTEDRARILLGLGASAISEFPDRILQKEKNAGRYRTAVAAGHLPIRRGIYRSEDDKRRAEIIRTLLCGGEADLSHLNDRQRITDSLLIFEERALVEREGWAVRIQPDAWAYSRVIASTIDIYRQPDARQFSSAI
jgi:oxygen-independent coproporphyrinogen III oxidase